MTNYIKNPYDDVSSSLIEEDYAVAMKITTLIDNVKTISKQIFFDNNDPEDDYVNASIENPYMIDSLNLNLLQIGELLKRFSDVFKLYYCKRLKLVSIYPFIQYRNLVAHFNIEDVEIRLIKELSTSKIKQLHSAIYNFRVYCSKREDVQTVESALAFATKNNLYDSYSDFCESTKDGRYIREIPVDVRKRLDKIFAHQVLNKSNHPSHVFNERLIKTTGQLLINKLYPGTEFSGDDDQINDLINLITESTDVQFLYYREPFFWVLRDI